MEVRDKALEDDGSSQELVLTLVASPQEVDECARRFFADIAKRDIPGFRKGKAPRDVLEQSVGGHPNAMGGVAELLINELAPAAIDDADVVFIEEPQFNVDAMLEEGKPFSFTVSGPVAPRMKLASCEPVHVELPPEEATEADVEAQLRTIQDYYHSFEPIDDPDHKAEMGDYAKVTMTITNHGRLVSGLNRKSRLVGLGEGTMPASFDEALLGAKVGDALEFDFEAKDEQGSSDYGDGELHAEVEVEGFRRCVLPPVDDELAAKVGCADVADLRRQVERTIGMQRAQERPKLLVDRAVDALVARLEGEVPAYYVDFVRQDVGRELMQKLDEQGTNLQQWMLQNAVNGDEMRADMAEEARRRAAVDCALEALFEAKGLEVTDEDVDALFEGDDGSMPSREAFEQAHRMADVRKMCRRAKATRWLADSAEVTTVEEPAQP